jgi:hypothetical protein
MSKYIYLLQIFFLGTGEGLPHDKIISIRQDESGFIWIITSYPYSLQRTEILGSLLFSPGFTVIT